MKEYLRKRAGAKAAIVLLSIFLFLLLFASVAAAVTLGDINNDGKVNVQDVVLARKHVLGIPPLLTAAQQDIADVTGDGKVDVNDVADLMKYSLGLIKEFKREAVRVASVSAVNGTVTVILTDAPKTVPVIADFRITQSINGAAATTVTPTVITWTAATKTAVLTVPLVAATTVDQSVVMTASYNLTAAKAAPAFIVAGPLKAVSVSVINARTIGVEFNRAPTTAEAAAVGITAKTAANATVSTSFSWDGKVARVVRTTGINYLAGTYTVDVTGVVPVFTGTVTIETPVATSLDIGATNIPDATVRAPLRVKLLDQYGEEMPLSDGAFNRTAFNVTTSTSLTHRISFDPVARFVINTDAVAGEFIVGNQVQITFVHIASGLNKTVTLPVVPQAQLAQITFGDVILPTGATNLSRDLVNVRIPFTAKDQYGQDLYLVNGANVNLFSSNTLIVSSLALSFVDTADGKQQINISNFLNQGTVNITVLGTPGGVVGSKTLNILQAVGEIATITPEVSALTIGKGSTGVVALTVKDAFGTTLTPAQYVGKIASVVSSNPAVVANTANLVVNSTVGHTNYGKLEIPVLVSATTGASTVITVTSVNGKTATVTVTAGAAPLPTSIEVKTTPVVKTSLLVGGTTQINYLVKDQYDVVMPVLTDYRIEYATVSGNNNIIKPNNTTSVTGDISGTQAQKTIEAMAQGNDGFRARLVRISDSVVINQVTTNFTVTAMTGLTYSIDPIATLYKNGVAMGSTRALQIDRGYAKEIVVKGSNGIQVPFSRIVSIDSSRADVEVFVQSEKWYVVTNDVALTTTDAVATLSAVVNADDGVFNPSRSVTISKDALQVDSLEFKNKLPTLTNLAALDLADITTLTLAESADWATNANLFALGTFYVWIKDQFGGFGLSYRIPAPGALEAWNVADGAPVFSLTPISGVTDIAADSVVIGTEANGVQLGALGVSEGSNAVFTAPNAQFRIIASKGGQSDFLTVTVTAWSP